MPTSSLLVNYVGYPNGMFGLVPDNGLANLAACLIAHGHRTRIWDCATVSMMERLYPHHLREELVAAHGRILTEIKGGRSPDQAMLAEFHGMEDEVDRYQEGQVRKLGAEMAEYVRANAVDFIGFKLWTGAGYSGARLLAEEIKRVNPDVKAYGGGPHVDWFGELVLRDAEEFDAVCAAEGEETIVALAELTEGRRRPEDVPNLIYRQNRHIRKSAARPVERLGELPVPVYDEEVYPAMRGDDKVKVILLDESRGCPNRCNFCIHPIKSGGRWRTVPSTTFVDRLEAMMRTYGFSTFRYAGSNPPPGLRRQIATEILRRGLKVTYSGFAHVRGAYKEDFGLLRRSGCIALSYGVESGSQKILDEAINKRIKVAEIREALSACKRAGIATIVSLIIPAPFETGQTENETFVLMQQITPDSTVVHFPAMVMGTEWERHREKFGFEIKEPNRLYVRMMKHRINPFAPAALWRPLVDYKLDGKDFREVAMETSAFIGRLRRAGLTTQLLDTEFLLSHLAGMTARLFGQLTHRQCLSGDVGGIRRLVARMNREMARQTDHAYEQRLTRT